MKLIDLLRQPGGWEEDATIYVARPWSCEAEAILVSPAPDTAEPVDQNGRLYDYFLETFIAREFLDDYGASPDGADATERARCERLIFYAENDA